MFPARHLSRSNCVSISLRLLQSSCPCCIIYFFISSNHPPQRAVAAFHFWEFVAILRSNDSPQNKWRAAVLFELFLKTGRPRLQSFLACFWARMRAGAALAQGHGGMVSILPSGTMQPFPLKASFMPTKWVVCGAAAAFRIIVLPVVVQRRQNRSAFPCSSFVPGVNCKCAATGKKVGRLRTVDSEI